MNSGIRENHINLGKGAPKVELDERNGCLILRGSVERYCRNAMVNATLAGKRC